MLSALKPWEKITSFILLLEPFSLANGQLTQTLKVKRHQVMTDYADIVRPFLPIGSSIASEKKKKK